MRKKEKDMSEDGSFSAPVPSHAPNQAASKAIAPADIQQKEFGVARFGGYKMRDVDEFLDQVTDSMSAVVRENEQLRNGGAAPVVGTSDLADVNRQADEIIQRARDEAAAIVAAARRQTSEGTAPAGDRSAADRAAIAAFLTREKTFLQSLAGLVQSHAEEVKTMARSSRPASTPEAAAPAAPTQAAPTQAAPPATPPRVAVEPAPPAPAAKPPAPAPAAAQPAESKPESTVALPRTEDATADKPEERISVVEPQPVAARRPDTGSDAPIEGEGSLRELFWGED